MIAVLSQKGEKVKFEVFSFYKERDKRKPLEKWWFLSVQDWVIHANKSNAALHGNVCIRMSLKKIKHDSPEE